MFQSSTQIKLQILLSKVSLSDRDKEIATSLVHGIGDWDAFISMSALNFNIPMVRRHLVALNSKTLPDYVLPELHGLANEISFRNLQIASIQKRFQAECLVPLEMPYLFIKGVTLAAQYYPDLGLRPCRDLDILVQKGTMERVARHAMSLGYQVVSPGVHSRTLTSAQDIQAALKYGSGLSLVSPEGLLIDLQDQLDRTSGIFDNVDLFANIEQVSFAGATFPTLSSGILFNYLCHHHARHTWSHLHWLSDLDAMISAKSFESTQALALAKQLGQLGTVEASLELHQLMSRFTSDDDIDDLERGRAFMGLCIANLGGALDVEKSVSVNLQGGEFMFGWQADPELISTARRRWWQHVLRPTLQQYARHPLPRILQPLYYIPRWLELSYLLQRRRRHLRRLK